MKVVAKAAFKIHFIVCICLNFSATTNAPNPFYLADYAATSRHVNSRVTKECFQIQGVF